MNMNSGVRSARNTTSACVHQQIREALAGIRERLSNCRRKDLDQCPATVGSVFRRAAVLSRRAVDLLLLGDDDLLGLSLALAGARRRITVLDLDSELLCAISDWAPRSRLHVRCHDLHRAIPP